MNQDEGDRYEQGLHDWLNSWEDRWSKESKPRQREHLIAERAMGPEPKLSEEAVQQIKKDFAFNDSIEMDGDKLPELDTDQSRLYRNEWEDWQFAKKKAKDYAVREQGRLKLLEDDEDANLDESKREALFKDVQGELDLWREVRQWFSWKAGYMEHLIRFRYIDFGNKCVLDLGRLNEFERLVFEILKDAENDKPSKLWQILGREFSSNQRTYDKNRILIGWDPNHGPMTRRKLLWQPHDRDNGQVSYSTFQRKIVPSLRMIKKTFTR